MQVTISKVNEYELYETSITSKITVKASGEQDNLEALLPEILSFIDSALPIKEMADNKAVNDGN